MRRSHHQVVIRRSPGDWQSYSVAIPQDCSSPSASEQHSSTARHLRSKGLHSFLVQEADGHRTVALVVYCIYSTCQHPRDFAGASLPICPIFYEALGLREKTKIIRIFGEDGNRPVVKNIYLNFTSDSQQHPVFRCPIRLN